MTDPCNIKVEARITGGSTCPGSRSIFVNAHQKRPYTVYGNYYYDDARCSTVLSVHENGTLKEVVQEYVYGPGSAVHGTAMTRDGEFLLSADTKGNLIWTHRIDPETGFLSVVDVIDGPSEARAPATSQFTRTATTRTSFSRSRARSPSTPSTPKTTGPYRSSSSTTIIISTRFCAPDKTPPSTGQTKSPCRGRTGISGRRTGPAIVVAGRGTYPRSS